MGDFEDLKTMLVEAKKKTGSDFMLINPMHAAEPVPPLTPSPYLPISRRFINFSYIRPESMPEISTLSHEDRAEVDALHEQVESLNDNARLIDGDAMWRVKRACAVGHLQGRPNQGSPGRIRPLPRRMRRRDRILRHLVPVLRQVGSSLRRRR